MICRWCGMPTKNLEHEEKCIERIIPEEQQGLKEGWLIIEEEVRNLDIM